MSQPEIKKPDIAAPKPPQSSSNDDARRVELPVATLKFVVPTDIPGEESKSGVKSGGPLNQRRWEVAYLPWMRHHRITFFEANKTEPSVTGYVHESRVNSWT